MSARRRSARHGLLTERHGLLTERERSAWITRLRSFGPMINRVSGGLLVIAGAYVAWYEYWDLQGNFGADPIVDGAAKVQTWLTNQVSDLP